MSAPSIEFLVKDDLQDFMFNPERVGGLSFHSADPALEVSIKPQKPEEDGFGHRAGVEVRITKRVGCTQEQARFVKAFITGKVVPYGSTPLSLPFTNKDTLVVDASGRLQKGVSFWFEWLPGDLQSLINDALGVMRQEQIRFLKLLRWQQNEILPLPERDEHMAAYWRIADKGLYHLIPFRGSTVSGQTLGGFRWEEQDQQNLRRLWERAEIEEPLAHELWGEAAQIADSSPRSALLMVASALEVGVKAHISRTAPVTDWLVFNLPSPPIYKVLRDYIPAIHPGDPVPVNWEALKPLFKRCQQLAEDRNKLTHAGSSPTTNVVEEYLSAVADVLYVLDYLDGEEWATEHVSHVTRTALGWPEPRVKRFFFSMSSGPEVG